MKNDRKGSVVGEIMGAILLLGFFGFLAVGILGPLIGEGTVLFALVVIAVAGVLGMMIGGVPGGGNDD